MLTTRVVLESDAVASAAKAIAQDDRSWVQTELTRQHAGLLEGILAGDADRARRECAAHIHWFATTTGIDAADR